MNFTRTLENTMRTTFTILLTLEHEPGQDVSHERVAAIVRTAFENGSFLSAQADAFPGRVIAGGGKVPRGDDAARLARVIPLHW